MNAYCHHIFPGNCHSKQTNSLHSQIVVLAKTCCTTTYTLSKPSIEKLPHSRTRPANKHLLVRAASSHWDLCKKMPPCNGPMPRLMYELGLLYHAHGSYARYCTALWPIQGSSRGLLNLQLDVIRKILEEQIRNGMSLLVFPHK
jgi:hypothetical protein